jgi:metal-responsive CopG/Arc/MetJ family transcriptional regulator
MIGLRLSGEETALVDAWGERHGMNRSDAIRAMIREVLDREKRYGKPR